MSVPACEHLQAGSKMYMDMQRAKNNQDTNETIKKNKKKT